MEKRHKNALRGFVIPVFPVKPLDYTCPERVQIQLAACRRDRNFVGINIPT
jgi:hypothetical protein